MPALGIFPSSGAPATVLFTDIRYSPSDICSVAIGPVRLLTMRISLGFLALAAALCGCSGVHPLPSDVVRLEVHQIVDQIRCEARATVMAVLNGAYKDKGIYPGKVLFPSYKNYKEQEKDIKETDKYHKKLQADEQELNEKGTGFETRKALRDLKTKKARLDLLEVQPSFERKIALLGADNATPLQQTAALGELGNALALRARALRELNRRKRIEDARFDKEDVYHQIDVQTFNAKSKHKEAELKRDKKLQKAGELKVLDTFLRHRFTYKLEFRLTHNENISSAFTFSFPILLGSVSIDQIDPTLQRERFSSRTVQAVASFEELIDMESCSAGKDARQLTSSAYPIEGEVGLKEVIVQYLKIVNHPDKVLFKTSGDKDGPETYTDSIRFKTVVGAGASPKISITQANGHKFTGQISPDITRSDEHTVTVFLSLEDGSEGDENGGGAKSTKTASGK